MPITDFTHPTSPFPRLDISTKPFLLYFPCTATRIPAAHVSQFPPRHVSLLSCATKTLSHLLPVPRIYFLVFTKLSFALSLRHISIGCTAKKQLVNSSSETKVKTVPPALNKYGNICSEQHQGRECQKHCFLRNTSPVTCCKNPHTYIPNSRQPQTFQSHSHLSFVIKGVGQQTTNIRGDYVLVVLEFDSLWLFSTPQPTLDTMTSKPSTDNSSELRKERKKENNKARSCASAAPVLNIIVLKYSVHAPLCYNH